MNILLFSMPDSFEHMPAVAIRMPNGALTSLAGNVDPHLVFNACRKQVDLTAICSLDEAHEHLVRSLLTWSRF